MNNILQKFSLVAVGGVGVGAAVGIGASANTKKPEAQ